MAQPIWYTRIHFGARWDRNNQDRHAGGTITGPWLRVFATLVTLTAGDRSFSYWRSGSAARDLAAGLDVLDAAGPDWRFFFSGITMAILTRVLHDRLLDRPAACREAGAQVVFDPNIRPRLWEDAATMRKTIGAGHFAGPIW